MINLVFIFGVKTIIDIAKKFVFYMENTRYNLTKMTYK